jgi:hypothetical protein
MWWSAEMHRRLTYPEWQSALPRMVRRWDDDCGHQLECDDDAASESITSTAAAVSEAEGRRHGPGRVVLKRVRPLPPDRARSASEVLSLSGASPGSPYRRTWLSPGWFIGGQCGHRQHCWQSAATVTRRRISTPGSLLPDATLLVHTLALPSSRAKLTHMRTFQSCGL